MSWILTDLSSPVNIIRFTGFFILGLIVFYLEYSKRFQLQYSKFRGQGNFPTRRGMVIIYTVPIITYLFVYYSSGHPNSLYHISLCIFVCFHFLKRVLEAIFLHKYSGNMGLLSLGLITYVYSAAAYTIAEPVNRLVKSEQINLTSALLLGGFIFIAGQIINLYHHIILAGLRKGDSKDYVVPQTGLFSYVVCPHYTGELLSWLGIAISSCFVEIYLIFWIMFSYLLARSINTKKWYVEKFPDFPKSRKFLFPYIL
ncbi:MAG: DUF1295 domain-containing protein [Leptospiraceae bacterium]|nr:DUF1295 domain-containing protein [Leptospiraceae bacterium]MCP5502229.1 DUF1295 domain-containing protein [Leptospiraceae bacterium]